MNKKIKYFIFLVIFVLLILSMFYMNKEHTYALTKLDEITTDDNYINVSYKQEELLEEGILGTLEIEKIDLKANVKEGSTSQILKKFIGHIEETAKYDGNIGLAAHNRLNQYSYFARINELEKGDKINYKTKFFDRTYIVYKKVVIYDTDWSYLKETNDNRITLITCIKNKPNQRLCIQAIEE